MTIGPTESGTFGQLLSRRRATGREEARRAGCATLLLVSLSAATLTAARSGSVMSPVWLLVSSVLFLAVPWLVWVGLVLWKTWQHRFNALFPAALAVWALAPVALEFVTRRFGIGEALEIIELVCLQNAALIAAVDGSRVRRVQIACVLSAFLTLFAVVIEPEPAVFVLAGLFGVMMLWWMMARYWERVRQTLDASHTDRCLPVRASVLGGVALIALLLLVTLGTTRASTYVLRGFMPSSGGDRWSDEFARSGVGDGDAMVAAEDQAMSFGPVESELFLESDMPTLYDMFSDMYGEPPRPRHKRERAISLASGDVQETEQRIAKTQRSGREFSTVRRRVERKSAVLEDRLAAAMLYVVGRVPLDLALERYDAFDGRQWTHSGRTAAHPPIRLKTRGGKPWMDVTSGRSSPIFRGEESHALKIINLKTNRIASPPHLAAVHVDRVDQVDFFGWSDDGVVAMPVREHIPQLTVVELRSQGVNLQSLRESDFTARFRSLRSCGGCDQDTTLDAQTEMLERHLEVPKNCDALAGLADRWTRGVPRGWRQVEAIVQRLRSDFSVDPAATAPATCDDVVTHFLQTGRGPDYLFATTAAMLLRAQGYPSRLVTGFYARPDRFDRRAGQTAILAQDVHVWVEVHVGGRTWIPIEPTPGYAPPRESLTWQQRLSLAWRTTWQWCKTHAGTLAAIAGVVVVVWATRLVWLDHIFALYCWVAGWGSLRRRVLWTARLLDWRARLAGCPRPGPTTLSAWHGSLAAVLPSETSACLRFALQSAEKVLYATPDSSVFGAAPEDVSRACSVVKWRVGIRSFRAAFNKARARVTIV